MEIDMKCERRGAEEGLSVVCSNVTRKFLHHECGARHPNPCHNTQTARKALDEGHHLVLWSPGGEKKTVLKNMKNCLG